MESKYEFSKILIISLANLRKKKKMSQLDVAKEMKNHGPRISTWEGRKASMPSHQIDAYLKAIGCSKRELVQELVDLVME